MDNSKTNIVTSTFTLARCGECGGPAVLMENKDLVFRKWAECIICGFKTINCQTFDLAVEQWDKLAAITGARRMGANATNEQSILHIIHGAVHMRLRPVLAPRIFGRHAAVEFHLADCDACGLSAPCLCADGSQDEYEPVRLCRRCIERAFDELAKMVQ